MFVELLMRVHDGQGTDSDAAILLTRSTTGPNSTSIAAKLLLPKWYNALHAYCTNSLCNQHNAHHTLDLAAETTRRICGIHTLDEPITALQPHEKSIEITAPVQRTAYLHSVLSFCIGQTMLLRSNLDVHDKLGNRTPVTVMDPRHSISRVQCTPPRPSYHHADMHRTNCLSLSSCMLRDTTAPGPCRR